ncbi:hypothetical protein LMG7974_00029 [Campylobacter majalis]|uniref:Calcineurin-like phosphoesterase domain-containing protein n=1 Tax=Campylobacter majalis TaxID=2790656 RepID=A0ABM8Q1N4_9BACT|nr:metallophosphoesterase [Campylobacter majalis]CAD7286678.1 hypothetical protein LMG7974_00029 [Campylobacter majalis]
MLRWVFVISVAFIASVLLNFYSYKRFLRKISFLQPYLKYIRVFIVFVGILEATYIFSVLINFSLHIHLYLAGAFLLGFSWFLFGVSVAYDVLRIVFKRTKFNSNRRKFLKFVFDTAFLVVFVGFLLQGVFSAIKPPRIKHNQIRISGLKSPLRIAVVSDIHIGDFLQKEFLAQLVYQINSTKPDIVAIVGDLADMSGDEMGDFLEPLKDLKSTYGTYYVPGNHEYYHGIDGILSKVNDVGVKILGNKNVNIGGLNLAGVYDVVGLKFNYLKPDLDVALSGINENEPTILLTHQPKFIRYMHKDVDLVICGHTHGGQIFPFHFLVLLDQPYLYGLNKHNDKMQVYVSSGAGFWGPPVRILAPSEIAILDLVGE